MKRWIWLMALALAAPLQAQDKKAPPPKKEAPANPDELARQADQKAAAGDVEGALALLQRAAEMPSASGEIALKLGRLQESRLEFDAAIGAYQTAAGKLSGPPKGEALGRQSVAQALRGMAQAPATAEAALQADPAGAWPLIAAARARASQGKGDEAAALADKAKSAGGGAAADAARGVAQEAKGDLGAAEAAYRAALGAAQGDAVATIGLARVLRKTGKAAEAEPLVQQVLAKAPGAVEAYKEMARIKLAQGRAEEAVGDAATAAALAENDPDAKKLNQEVIVAKALVMVGAGQSELAIQDLTQARDQAPDSPEIRLGLAKALIARRQSDAALAELQKAVELDPKNADAQYQLGFVSHVMKANAAGAVGAFDKAAALEPGNTLYRTALGAALNDTKQNDRAITELSKVTASPGYAKADAWIYLGEAHLALKHYKDASEALDKAVSFGDNARAEASLAWAYFGLKNANDFKKHAGKAKALGYKEPTLLGYLTRIEAGEAIK